MHLAADDNKTRLGLVEFRCFDHVWCKQEGDQGRRKMIDLDTSAKRNMRMLYVSIITVRIDSLLLPSVLGGQVFMVRYPGVRHDIVDRVVV